MAKNKKATLEYEMWEVCKVRKECELPCRRCMYYDICDGNARVKENKDYANNKEQNK